MCVGPVRGRAAAAELVEQLNSLFGLRHCGRTLPRREHPSAYGQMGRCLSPCLNDLDPNLYRERLDQALQLFVGARRRQGAARARRRSRSARPRPSAATSARPGCSAAASASRRCWSAWAACCARRTRARGSCSRRTREAPGRFDAIWIAGGRVVDWGPVAPRRDDAAETSARAAAGALVPAALMATRSRTAGRRRARRHLEDGVTLARDLAPGRAGAGLARAGDALARDRAGDALARDLALGPPGDTLARDFAARSARAFSAAPAPGKLGGWLPAEAVAEARLVGMWIAANRPPALELGARTGEAAHAAFLARLGVTHEPSV